jgi:hypothetical protein
MALPNELRLVLRHLNAINTERIPEDRTSS